MRLNQLRNQTIPVPRLSLASKSSIQVNACCASRDQARHDGLRAVSRIAVPITAYNKGLWP